MLAQSVEARQPWVTAQLLQAVALLFVHNYFSPSLAVDTTDENLAESSRLPSDGLHQ